MPTEVALAIDTDSLAGVNAHRSYILGCICSAVIALGSPQAAAADPIGGPRLAGAAWCWAPRAPSAGHVLAAPQPIRRTSGGAAGSTLYFVGDSLTASQGSSSTAATYPLQVVNLFEEGDHQRKFQTLSIGGAGSTPYQERVPGNSSAGRCGRSDLGRQK